MPAVSPMRRQVCADPVGRRHRHLPPDRRSVSYTHLRAHETVLDLVCRLLLEKKKETTTATEPTQSGPATEDLTR